MSKPLAIDLFCGLGGWAEGLLAEGYEVIGYDIEAHDYGSGGYPGTLVLQDVTALHGSQFKDAALIVASPPCQRYSYMAMPWSRAKAQAAAIEADTSGDMRRDLNQLFDTCFRLQREASEAAGRNIPMVVENVRGAQKWVGRAAWHHGSFFLWGDVPALMPVTWKAAKVPGFRFDGEGGSFQTAAVKVQGINFNGHGEPGHKAVGFNVTAAQRYRDGQKSSKDEDGGYGGGFGWDNTPMRRGNSRSDSRKAASAMIAKIPFPLAQHIAKTYKPVSA